jgi:hypothetical protein
MIQLFEKWEMLATQGGVGVSQRVVAEGLPQYIGIDAQGRWSFFSLSEREPESWPDVKLIHVTKKDRNGQWRLTLTLLDENFQQEFAYLCEDLVSKVAGVSLEELALLAQKTTYEDWLEFFRGRKSFSAEAARGLFGELHFMALQLASGVEPRELVKAWKGPLGAPQDFVFDEFKAVEVKSLQSQAAFVQISNENQLDFPGTLQLEIYRIQENVNNAQGMTLSDLVDKLIRSFPQQLQGEFVARLVKTGYTTDVAHVGEVRYSIGETYSLDANRPSFPKITPATIPLGISRVKYAISVAALLGGGSTTHAS